MARPPLPPSGSAARRGRWLALALQLAAGSTAAYCGAKGSPQPPLREVADAGSAAADAGPAAPNQATDGGTP